MPQRFCCPRGHEWEGLATALSPGSEAPTCPNCGEAALAPTREPSWSTREVSDIPAPSAPSPEPARSLPHIPGYDILGELGHGGQGVVYKAWQTGLRRLVALKMILTGNFAGPDEVARFRAEAVKLARAEHPHIVHIHDVGQFEQFPYFVMEFVEGGSLAQKLHGAPLPPPEAARLLETVAQAIHEAHRRDIIHRDLKPANVLLTPDGLPKITDFGLAKGLDAELATEGIEAQSVSVVGTPPYMAPEQAAGKGGEIGPRTDVYGLGAILYECLTGRPPFRSASSRETMRQVCEQEPVAPRQLNAAVPRDLETICLKCLRKEPSRRYVSAAELAEDLGRFLRGEPVKARPVGRLERLRRWCRRNPAVASLLALVLLLMAAGTSLAWVLAVRATAKAEEALQAQDRAEQEQGRADRAAKEALRRKVEAEQAQQRAEAGERTARRNLFVSRMNLAQRAWQDVNVARVLQLLELSRPGPADKDDPRGFEWHYLWRLCHHDRLTLPRQASPVNHLAYSRDGKLLAVGSTEGQITLWQPATGKPALAPFKAHPGPITGLVFSLDGTRLASTSFADRDGLKIWEATTGRLLRSFPKLGPGSWSKFSPTFDPRGQKVAAGEADGRVSVWEADTGKLLWSVKQHTGDVGAVAFSPDGERVASAGRDGMVGLWEAALGKKALFFSAHAGEIRSLAFSPDSKFLASAGRDRTIKVWDLATGRPAFVLQRHTDVVHSVAFSPDGQRLASAGGDQTVRVWDATTGSELVSLRGHTGPVFGVAFSPDGRRLASCSYDHTIRFWDVAAEQDVFSLKGHADEIRKVVFSPDGKLLASASRDRSVKVWDRAGKELLCFQEHATPVLSVAFSPDGRRLASGDQKGIVTVWEAATGKVLATFRAHQGNVQGLAFSPDGLRIVSAGLTGTVRVWEASTGKELRAFEKQWDLCSDLAFSRDGKFLALAANNLRKPGDPAGKPAAEVRVWEAATGKLVSSFTRHSNWVTSLAFSPDGKHLATADRDWVVKVWETATGKEELSLKGHAQPVVGVTFSPDGRRLASAGQDGTIKVWERATGQEVLVLWAGGIQGLAFSPRSNCLAAACADWTVKLWEGDLPTPDMRLRREALALLDELFTSLVRKADVVAHLRHQVLLPAELRRAALAEAEDFRPNPVRLAVASERIVRRPGARAAAYQLALLQAEEACRLVPEHGLFRNVLGMSQYRVGQYRSAVRTLAQADTLNTARLKVAYPGDLAFLAMAYSRLGEMDKARSILDRLGRVMKTPRWSMDNKALALRREAEAVVRGQEKD